MNCLICNASTSDLGPRIPNHRLWECRRCGFTFAHELSKIVNSTAPDTATILTDPSFTKDAVEQHERRSADAARLLPARIEEYQRLVGRKIERVLEVGCGDAAWAESYLRSGIYYEGIEILPELVNFAQKRGLPVRLQEFSAHESLRGFDVIYASQVVEHVSRPADFFRHAYDLLNPGGILHIDVPNHHSLVSLIRRAVGSQRYGALESPHHLMAHTPDSIRRLLNSAGLVPVLVEGIRNDHPSLGQIITPPSPLVRFIYAATGALRMGSLLCGIGRKAQVK